VKQRLMLVVMQPRERVREALCARTCELLPYLEQIEDALLQEHGITSEGLARSVHAWQVRADVPAILAHHLDRSLLQWTSCVEWNPDGYESRWIVRPSSTKSSLQCEATVTLAPAVGGAGTRVTVEVSLNAFENSPGLQTIASSMLSSHFRQLVAATDRFLASH